MCGHKPGLVACTQILYLAQHKRTHIPCVFSLLPIFPKLWLFLQPVSAPVYIETNICPPVARWRNDGKAAWPCPRIHRAGRSLPHCYMTPPRSLQTKSPLKPLFDASGSHTVIRGANSGHKQTSAGIKNQVAGMHLPKRRRPEVV